jgi:predicted methyltransferase
MRKSVRWRLPLFLIIVGVVLYAAWPHLTIDHEAQVDALIQLLVLQPGMTAGEVGAGEGRMSVILAHRLGPSGRVFATELDTAKLKQIRKAGLPNITVIRAAEKATNLPEDCCDAIFMRRVYHHFTDGPAINADLFLALRPGGRLAVIDFPPTPWMFWLRPFGEHGTRPEALIEQVSKAGFVLERRVADWPGRDYCVVFRKPV